MTASISLLPPSTPTLGFRVAFQGERGAYGDLAIDRLWGPQAQRFSHRDFIGVVHAVSSGSADFGVLPVHNVIMGPIAGARAALAGAEVVVEGHVDIPVRHCVLGIPGTRIEEVRRVYSHVAALGQCTRLIAEHRFVAVPHYDTAGAARYVARRGDRTEGAIASEECAERYGLSVLLRAVSDLEENRTRFVVVARGPRQAPNAG
jgi:prephenate dehydratase